MDESPFGVHEAKTWKGMATWNDCSLEMVIGFIILATAGKQLKSDRDTF